MRKYPYYFTIEDVNKHKGILPDRYFYVIENRLKGITLAKIAKDLKVTPERVRQMESKISEKIRTLIKEVV